jgi:hypothetical protein
MNLDEPRDPPPLKRPVGASMIREQLRLLEPGRRMVHCRREDLVRALKQLDALLVETGGQLVGKRGRGPGGKLLTEESGRESVVEGRKATLMRLRPKVSEGVKAYAAARGGVRRWSISRAVNELLESALSIELES